jgi:hypothetical protein
MTIDNTADMIDSRDIIERLAELDPFDDDAPLTEEEAAERASLLALADQAVDYAEDWLYGVTLIRDSYFKEYARADRRLWLLRRWGRVAPQAPAERQHRPRLVGMALPLH